MDEEELEPILKQLNRYLLQRDRCRSEVVQYMERKKLCRRSESEAVLVQLEAAGLLDDERFARNRVEYRIGLGYGPRYIQNELRGLRVQTDIVARALEVDDDLFLNAARRVLDRKRRSLNVEDPRELNEKLTRHLMSRGFSHQHAKKLLSGGLEALE